MGWEELRAAIEAENARVLDTPPEDVLRVFKFDILNTGAAVSYTHVRAHET